MKRPWALPLLPIYQAGVAAENFLQSRGVLPRYRLQRPVISIGSLSAGGAGKTPFVLALARLLSANGISSDVLSRGYGRTFRSVEHVLRDGEATRFGDEPLELARAGLDVFVGADRFAAGTLAERVHSAEVHLLDDGFQHRRLERSLDVALLTAEDAADCLLPAGNLREPFSALRRADAVVIRREQVATLTPLISHHTGAEIWIIERSLHLTESFPRRPVVFCAIARPEAFLTMLRSYGVDPAAVVVRSDHYAWRRHDFEELALMASKMEADGFITTAKDSVKLQPDARAVLERVGRVEVAELRVTIVDPERILQAVRLALGS